MKVTRILGSLLVLAVVTSAAPVHAAPAVSLYWDVCAPGGPLNLNKNFAGPGIYKLVFSGNGFSGGVLGQRQTALVGGPGGLGDAWRFDATGCNTGQVSFSTAGLSKTCPKLEGTNPLALTQYGYDPLTLKGSIDVANAFDMFAAAATQTYTLFSVNLDHSFSAVGPNDPTGAVCGRAQDPVCIHMVRSSYLDASNNELPAGIANEWVTWQDPNNGSHCPGATASVPSTWGSIKNQYHR